MGLMKMTNIKDRITESRLRWAGHVWRRDQTKLSRDAGNRSVRKKTED